MNSRLWSRTSPSNWKEGLPIGNGALGAMVCGNSLKERLALNHEWLWRAKHRRRDAPVLHQHLPRVRELLFAGRMQEAGDFANDVFFAWMEGRHRVDAFQPAGDFRLDYSRARPQNYRRELDLDRALVTVRFEHEGIECRREMFAHARLPVIVVRLTCSGPNAIECRASLSRAGDPECLLHTWSEKSAFGFEGAFVEGSRFAVEARLWADGEISWQSPYPFVNLKGFREALFLLTIAVAHEGEDPRALCARQLQGPADWDELLAGHVAEHGRLFSRVTLDLGGGDDRPTDERLADLRKGADDRGLPSLYFDFGRYLLISSSRPGGLPANLQGVWNEDLAPPWEADFHHDINLQMNYWLAEACGLAECAGPLFDHVERFLPHGRKMARNYYDCGGVLLPIQSDPWGRATAESPGWAVWVGAAAWLAQHFWWRYEYSLDRDFLRDRAYPLFRAVAAFFRDYLVPDPKGRLVPAPSQSPENTFVGGSRPVSLCVAATSDVELIDDVLSHAIDASEILDVDADLREAWRGLRGRLPPLQVGRFGQLQEWLEDYEEREPGHRHSSHLIALFPGERITVEEELELARAARVSLERRLAAGGGHTGWSRAWVACCWARLGEGDLALEHLKALLTDHTTRTLLDLHPPQIFQIDGNLGGAAAVAEMLLQSHRGLIRVLPALPRAWARGRVTGLCARGAFALDIAWADGRAASVIVRSGAGGGCRMRFNRPETPRATGDGCPISLSAEGGGVFAFNADRGREYRFEW